MSLSSLITLMWYMIVWKYINEKKKKKKKENKKKKKKKKKKKERKLKQNQTNVKVGVEQGTKVDDE